MALPLGDKNPRLRAAAAILAPILGCLGWLILLMILRFLVQTWL